MTDTTPTSKACTKCGVVKPLGEFAKSKKGLMGKKSQCKTCGRHVSEKWRKNNPEAAKTGQANWYKKTTEYAKDRALKWQRSHQEHVKKYVLKSVSGLSDSYVSGLLGIHTSQATPEQLELKRFEITLKRGIKVLKQSQTQKGTKS